MSHATPRPPTHRAARRAARILLPTRRPFVLARPPAANGFLPGTPNDQWIAPVWVADPQLGKAFFVRLMLFDKGTILAFADSPRIAAQ